MNPPLGTLLALCSMEVAPIHRIRSVSGIIELVRLDQNVMRAQLFGQPLCVRYFFGGEAGGNGC
jgi:hypothetical protein